MKSPELILPITDLQVNTLVKWRKEPDPDSIAAQIEEWSQQVPIEQLISTILIQQVPALLRKRQRIAPALERALAQLVESTRGEEEAFLLRESIPQQIDLNLLAEGARELASNAVDVLRQSELGGSVQHDFSSLFAGSEPPLPEPPDFLDSEGRWDFEFSRRQHNRRNPFTRDVPLSGGNSVSMTDPQARFFNIFLSQPDESGNLMSYFGGGKTFIAKEMLRVIQQYQEFTPVVLAQTKAQLGGLMKRLDAPETRARTFGQVVWEILASERIPAHWRPGDRRDPNYRLSSEEIARRMTMGWVGNLSPAEVADIAIKAVRRFCRSGKPAVSRNNLPTLKDKLSDLDRTFLVDYAQKLWNETVEPADIETQLPVRAYHQIKYCALRGFTIPDRYTHLIIDEAHDLSWPMMQILDASPQSVQTMGDPYQRLFGFIPSRSKKIRQSEIGLTVRASNQVENIFNTLIDKHPVNTHVALQGSNHMRTRITYYDPSRPRIPQQKTTILVSDLFELTEWFHKLREAKTSFSLLPGSVHNFFSFNASLVQLYFQGARATSPVLFRYPSWGALRAAKGHTNAFQRVEAMLAGGASREHDFGAAGDSVTTPEKATVILGLAEHARNLEFDRVMLAPDLLTEQGNIQNAQLQAHVLSSIYVGASRARYELVLPGHLRDWLETQPAFKPDDFEN